MACAEVREAWSIGVRAAGFLAGSFIAGPGMEFRKVARPEIVSVAECAGKQNGPAESEHLWEDIVDNTTNEA
jgi:hypothetical protein